MLEALDLRPVTGWLLTALMVLRAVLWMYLRAAPPAPARGPRGGPRNLLDWLDAGLVAAALVVLLIRPQIGWVQPVGSGSMAPTLRGSQTPQIDGPNDRVVVCRYLYRCRDPRRGEVVVFRGPREAPDEPAPWVVKRLVALPGDTVEIDLRGQLLVNGQVLAEDYVSGPSDVTFPRREVPAGMAFVLGDNRAQSNDSAHWVANPFLPLSEIRGKAVAICWPPDRSRLLR
ncbi:MAG: signal peptidase I [Fimbriimonadaceae bacterium]|nr:signal peptidase I [Fimbriimonadaceae bacterium]